MPVLPDPKREAFAVQVARGVAPLKAYNTCGYEPSSSGMPYVIEKEPDVAKRIAEIRRILAIRREATADRVIAELARIGFADITEMVSIERGRVKIKDTSMISPDLRAAIAEIQKGKEGIRVKMHDKRAALEMLGKHLGLFKENVDLHVDISLADLVTGSYELAKPKLAAGSAEIVEGIIEDDQASHTLPSDGDQ